MTRKKKKNSRSPIPREVTFVKIYEDDKNPWPSDYYMCGMCGHAISIKDVEDHARTVHKARSLRLLEIDDSPLTEEEAARRTGSPVVEMGAAQSESSESSSGGTPSGA